MPSCPATNYNKMNVDWENQILLVPVRLDEYCANVNGTPQGVIPIAMYNGVTGEYVSTSYTDYLGNAIDAATITTADPCDCECKSCNKFETCLTLIGWDNFEEATLTLGATKTFEVIIDGVVVTTVVIDYLAYSDHVNKSTWFTPLLVAINALPNWTISLNTDISVNVTGRCVWNLEYSGAVSETLAIGAGVGSVEQKHVINVDHINGIVTTSVEDSGIPMAEFGTPTFNTVPCNV